MDKKKGKGAPPKLHKFMHPKNPYKTPPSFKLLAQKYPSFRAYTKIEIDGKVRLDFKDPKAVRELTTCLLDQDFGLKVKIPDGRLVPTLPLRFNYLLWIEDLLKISSYHRSGKKSIVGVDIGCGGSCVYPLLAAKQMGWCMVSTETDDINFNSATNNVKENNFDKQILVRKVKDDEAYKFLSDENVISFINDYQNENSEQSPMDRSGEYDDGYIYDFTMCNPPFFSSVEEADSMSKSRKQRSEPSSAPTGALQEMVIDGGEVAFIVQMIDESVQLMDKVRIFTTMIGTKSHVKEIKDKLKSVNPAHSSVVEFCQGRTMRWGLAWTFNPNLHLENVMSKKQMVDAKPLVLMLPRSLIAMYTVRTAWAMTNKWLHQLKMTVQVFKNTKYFVGANIKAYKPTWLNQRRKKREQQRKEANSNKDDEHKEISEEMETGVKDIKENSSLKRMAESALVDDLENETANEATKPSKMQKVEDSNDTVNEQSQLLSLDKSSVNQSPKKLKTCNEECEIEDEVLEEDLKEVQGNNEDAREVPENSKEANNVGLQCILKAKLQVKQCGGLISMEALYLRGSAGKDGLNQVLQYFRNKLTNPT